MVYNYPKIKTVILRLTREVLLAFRFEERVETLTFEGEVLVSVGKIY